MKLSFIAADTKEAQKSLEALNAKYGCTDKENADVIVALGGDGTMLETMHKGLQKNRKVPVYGMNKGSLGFLLNPFHDDDLIQRIKEAKEVSIHPLNMRAIDEAGKTYEAIAFNEISLMRQRRQAAKIEIIINGVTRLDELVCDGAMVATAAGSTAYNLSAHGPILPIGANLLTLTPISAFRPRRWRGALLPETASFKFRIINPSKRPVSATADFTEIRNVAEVHVCQNKDIEQTLLFDPDHNLEERILKEQFTN